MRHKNVIQRLPNKKLSALGLGAMRLPLRDCVYAFIDEASTEKMVAYA